VAKMLLSVMFGNSITCHREHAEMAGTVHEASGNSLYQGTTASSEFLVKGLMFIRGF
jgi:hypothetical protein